MADTQPCPVHTLLEDIDSSDLLIRSLNASLEWLSNDAASMDNPVILGAIDTVRRDARAIADSHKFDFSGWGSKSSVLSEVLLETGIEMLNSRIAALPFPAVVFCQRKFFSHGESPMDEVVLLRQCGDKETAVLNFRSYHRLGGATSAWYFDGFTATYDYGRSTESFDSEWVGDPAETFQVPDSAGPEFDRGDPPALFVGIVGGFVASALAALSSRGPEIRTLPAPKFLNKQRAKKGKPPLFEYRIVEIPAWAKAKAEDLGSTHASPRLHWRRGHERRLGGGRKTFVHAHLVGAAENGFIHKDYAVAPPANP